VSIATTTFLNLKKYLMQACGDWLQVPLTTAIAASKVLVSTNLNEYDNASDGNFDGYWAYIEDYQNAGVERMTGLPGTTTYATSTGTLTCLGANFTSDSANKATIRLSRYKPEHYKNALIRACEECYPTLHKPVDNITLVTGNIIPDGHLESWSSATALNHWTATNITLARTSTAGETRGGTYAAKCTATAANGYISIHSNNFPKLLELQNKTVDAYAQALPETADDATIIIYTKQADGTAQTLTSTTSNPAGEFTLIKLENQTLNDDLVEVEFRLKVATSGQYVIYDDVYLGDKSLSEYLLPDDFVGGKLLRVVLQLVGTSSEVFYDANPFLMASAGRDIPFDIRNDGTNQYLKLLEPVPTERRLRLIGHRPLEVLSDDTDTLTLDVWRIPLLIAYAREIFWEREVVPLSSEDRDLCEREASRARKDKRRLMTQRMPEPIETWKR